MKHAQAKDVDRSIDGVAKAIRDSRVMFMAPGDLSLETLKHLLSCANQAGVRSFEVLRRKVDQMELANKLRLLREYRDTNQVLAEMQIGVGTIKRTEHLQFLVETKPLVDFVVSPYYSNEVREKLRQRVLYIPGVDNGASLGEVEKHGLKIWKWFPASELGPERLKAWKSVLDPDTFIIATGGITVPTGSEEASFAGWAPFGGIGIGSQFVKNGMINNALWNKIGDCLKSAIETMQSIPVVL